MSNDQMDGEVDAQSEDRHTEECLHDGDFSENESHSAQGGADGEKEGKDNDREADQASLDAGKDQEDEEQTERAQSTDGTERSCLVLGRDRR